MNEIIHANLVGSIKKDIYIIKNDINQKVYIGQSLNAENRFKSHCKGDYDNSLIDKAIQKYGKQHFWYELLAFQVEDYNIQEKEYIQLYNSLAPNGYNLQLGGEEPPRYLGDNHPSTKLLDKELILLIQDLKYTSLSLNTLAQKYEISKRQVLRINQGLSRIQLNEEYPITKNHNTLCKLSQDQVEEILELLQYSYLFHGDIARRFNIEVHLVSDINQGLAYRQSNMTYPIRTWKSCGKNDFTYEQVTEIINLLKKTKRSFRDIARQYNVAHNQISAICYGTTKKYKRKEETYPLRNIS